jgi:large subunit ribosomal protein L29
MLFSEISGLTAKELIKKKKELQAAMFDARMKNTLGQLPNQMVIRTARKDIARINTAMTSLVKKGASQSASKTASATTKPAAKTAGKKVAAKKTATRGKKG